MLSNGKLGFIGCGKMGEAMVRGILHHGLVEPTDIIAATPRDNRRAELAERFAIRTTASNREVVEQAEILILACKPQNLHAVVLDLEGIKRHEFFVISILAGVTIKRLQSIHATHVVRAMPNIPGQIGEGISVWTATNDVTENQRATADRVLRSLGEAVFVDDERYMDMATALSGTGPAYFFLMMEALIDAGVHLGFPRHIAQKLVEGTALGSVKFAMQANRHPVELRNDVTSPGGTTAAALYEAEKGRFRTVIADAVWAAHRRSLELGRS